MTPDRLLAHFDRLADAPDAIPRLRRFILDLAVRGKLVEQDSDDEPASAVVAQMENTKRNLGKRRAKPSLPPLNADELPHDLPLSWKWIRVGEGFIYDAGTKRSPHDLQPNWWLLELEDIEKDTSVVLQRLTVEDRKPRSTKSEFQTGDILYGKLRPYLNKVVVATEPGYSTTKIVAIRPLVPMCSGYCCLAFRRPDFVAYVNRMGQGTKMPRLRTQDAVAAPFPLPPLAEQRRIVARVDELMAFCDQLEAAQVKRESWRDRLTRASLHRLNQPADPSDANTFRTHARFVLDHLPRLTTRVEHIAELRQTVLNLAVRGRLVPQDPNDEAASKLLERIQAEKLEAGRGNKASSVKQVTVDTEPFALPKNWCWSTLREIAHGLRYGTSKKCSYDSVGAPVLRIPNVANGRVEIQDLKYAPLPESEAEKLRLRAGDILMVRSNGSLNLVGRPALVESHAAGFCYAGYLVRVRTSATHLNSRYLLYVLNSPFIRNQIEIPIRTTVGLKNINATELGRLPVPLPPLAEQHRIVAKVDELMVVCDGLEAGLSTAQADSRRLLEAILHEALSENDGEPAEQNNLEAAAGVA